MADSTIDSELIFLYDNWPGPVEKAQVPPGHGLLDKRFHNVTSPARQIGEKIQVWNLDATGEPGPSVLVYLQVGTQNGADVLAAKAPVVPDSATLYYQVTDDPDSCIKLPTALGAVCLSAMTDAYYGWFWCGGVCPETFVPTLGGNYATDGTVAAGDFIYHDLTKDEVGLGLCSGVNEPPAGFALAADA